MNKATYQKRLADILDAFSYLPSSDGLKAALQAICLLNEEAIGVNDKTIRPGLGQTGNYERSVRNRLRKELKAVIGVSNE